MEFLKTNRVSKLVGLAVILVLLILPMVTDSYSQHLFIMVCFYAFVAAAWNIVCGFVGELSLGHSVFIGVGGYVSTLLLMYAGMSPWIGMFIGAAVAALFGLLIGLPCFKLRGPYFTLTSIAFGELVRIWVENNENIMGIDIKGAQGLLLPTNGNSFINFEFGTKAAYYYVILAFLGAAVLITYLIKTSKLGYYLTAIKSDPDAAESLGIPLAKYKMIAMLSSTFLIALGGTFYAQYFRYIGPTRIFSHDLSVQVALICLVGGQGTILGPVLGAVILVPISEFLSESFGGSLPGLHLFVYGFIMVLVVFFMPQGLNHFMHQLWARVSGKAGKNSGPVKAAKGGR